MNTSTPVVTTPLKTEDKLWIVLSHLSLLLGFAILAPLIVYLVKKDDSAFVGHHAKEALNFHISLLLYSLACIPLVFIIVGVPLLIVLAVAGFVLSIVAAIRGTDGREYRYPLTIRLI